MKRSKPLRRTAFRSIRAEGPTASREPRPLALVPVVRPLRSGTYSGGTSGIVIAKENAVECEAYRRLVASLPCIHCGISGYSQAAHPNTGKGGSLKTDDRECFPLCTVHPVGLEFVVGCHERFDQGVLFTKRARRELEPAWGAQTRHALMRSGLVPPRLAALLKLQPDGSYAP